MSFERALKNFRCVLECGTSILCCLSLIEELGKCRSSAHWITRPLSPRPLWHEADLLVSEHRVLNFGRAVLLSVWAEVEPRVLSACLAGQCTASEVAEHGGVLSPGVLLAVCAEAHALLEVTEVVVDDTEHVVGSHLVTVDHLTCELEERVVFGVEAGHVVAESEIGGEEPEVVILLCVDLGEARAGLVWVFHALLHWADLEPGFLDSLPLCDRLLDQRVVCGLHLRVLGVVLHHIELCGDACCAILAHLRVGAWWVVFQTRFFHVGFCCVSGLLPWAELALADAWDRDLRWQADEWRCHALLRCLWHLAHVLDRHLVRYLGLDWDAVVPACGLAVGLLGCGHGLSVSRFVILNPSGGVFIF